MKKLAVMLSIASLALASVPAYAVPNSNVAATKHNLSVTGPTGSYNALTETQICVFCHTPHNAAQTRALWNRNINATGFSMFTSSAVGRIPYFVNNANRPPNMESLFCLSCHDGRAGVNVVHSLNPNPVGNIIIETQFAGPGVPVPIVAVDFLGNPNAALIGTNLTDDHPISFNYQTVIGEVATLIGNTNSYVQNPTGVLFYPKGGGSNVECGTCHDPHYETRDAAGNPMTTGPGAGFTPMLRVTSSGSQLCLSCHNK